MWISQAKLSYKFFYILITLNRKFCAASTPPRMGIFSAGFLLNQKYLTKGYFSGFAPVT